MKPSDEHSASVLLYLDGEFSGHELEDFLAHLANCVDCTMSLEEEKALSKLLRRTRPQYSAPETLRMRVLQIVVQSADTYNYAPDHLC
jgi:mycothiol system anti-sigma-R factor